MNSVWPVPHDLLLSAVRWFTGLTAGTLIGLIIAMGESALPNGARARHWSNRMASMLLDFLRAMPIIALVPVVQQLGVEEIWKISLIAWAVMFPVWLSIKQARSREMVDTELAMFAASLNHQRILRKYQLPKGLGGLLRGVEISIGVAWLSVVAAEWVGTYTSGFWAGGLGYRVVKAHEANNWGGMLMCLGLFGLLGSTTAWIWRMAFGASREIRAGFNPLAGYADE